MPITDDEMIEGMLDCWYPGEDWRSLDLTNARPDMRAALVYARPIIEREARTKALDEAAELASFWADPSIPLRILALKDTPHD